MPVDPTGWLRVGGLPSWRSVITIKLPEQIQGSVEVCGSTECSFDLSKSQLNLAELILTTRETEETTSFNTLVCVLNFIFNLL